MTTNIVGNSKGSPLSSETRVASLRAFNRFYTEVLGLLRDGLLETPYSLAEARVLFELAARGGSSLTALAEGLQVDLGYASRLVSLLKKRGLVVGETARSDRRLQVISLTGRGRQAFRLLDEKASAQIRELLTGLTEDGQARLVACTSEIQALLGERKVPTVVLRGPVSGDYGWVVQRHGAIYRQEYGWDETFEALVARIVSDYIQGRDPQHDAAWIAEVDRQRVGCVFCMQKEEHLAQLRILLVEPSARGMGIGSRLVDECIHFARRVGYKQMMLWTNDVLVDARRIYERAGFRLVDEENHRSFGQDLIGQNWLLDL